MTKIDLKKEYKQLYAPSAKKVDLVDVPPFHFLMIDGAGDPNTAPEYSQAIEALFTVSYTAKFMVKKGPQALDYAVMPLEGLWWSEDVAAFDRQEKEKWQWTMMILQPPFVDKTIIEAAMSNASKAKKLPSINALRFEVFAEGRCAQTLHIGPFSEEGSTLSKLHAVVDAQTGRRGKHHEIYLSDIRRAEPSKWKTILRQPML
jgi:hypothetical protein